MILGGKQLPRHSGKALRIAVTISLVALGLSPVNPADPAFAQATSLPVEQCKKYGNNLLGSSIRYEDSGHVEDWSRFARPVGELKVLLLATDFSDVPAKTSMTQIRAFANRLTQEFSRLSYGVLDFKITVHPEWMRLPKSARYYSAAEWTEKITDSLVAADPSYDFKEFDLFIIKTDEKNSVINVAGALPIWGQELDGKSIHMGVYLGRDYWTEIGQGVQVGLHEIAHVFGLPDLYMANPDKRFPVGIFDSMSNYSPDIPPQMFGWHRWKLGWLQDSEITCLDPRVEQRLTLPRQGKKNLPVVFPIGENRVIVVERWQPSSRRSASSVIVYEVNAKSHVWASGGELGKISPIQIVPPAGKKLTLNYGDGNRNNVLRPNQRVQTKAGVFRISLTKSNINLIYAPKN